MLPTLAGPAGDLSLISCPSGQGSHYRDQIDSLFVSDKKTGQAEGVAGIAVHTALPFSSHGTSEVIKSGSPVKEGQLGLSLLSCLLLRIGKKRKKGRHDGVHLRS